MKLHTLLLLWAACLCFNLPKLVATHTLGLDMTYACIDSCTYRVFYNAYHHIENLNNPEGEKKVYNVVGYVCETDSFAADRIIPEVRKGDLLVFKNAGAYCSTMASNYNSRPRPAEVLMLNKKDYLVRRRETIEDMMRTQVEVEIEY